MCLRKARDHWIPGHQVSCCVVPCQYALMKDLFMNVVLNSWRIKCWDIQRICSRFAFFFLLIDFSCLFCLFPPSLSQWFPSQAVAESPWLPQRLRRTRGLRGRECCWLSWQFWWYSPYWPQQDTSVSHLHSAQDDIQYFHYIRAFASFAKCITKSSATRCLSYCICKTPFKPVFCLSLPMCHSFSLQSRC